MRAGPCPGLQASPGQEHACCDGRPPHPCCWWERAGRPAGTGKGLGSGAEPMAVPVPVLGGEWDWDGEGNPFGEPQAAGWTAAKSRVHVLGGCGAWASGLPVLGSTAQALQSQEDRMPPQGMASLTLARLPATAREISIPRTTLARGWRREGSQALPRSIHARTAHPM